MRELLQSNFALKIFSLVLATLVWFAVESKLHRKTRTPANPYPDEVTLELPCPVAALVVAGAPPAFQITPLEVTVRMAGKPEVLGEIDASRLPVFVRVPPKLDTEETLPLEVKLPNGVRLVDVQPREATVTPKAAN